jgi:hypothetical protein
LEWLWEDIQDLLDCHDKPDVQQIDDSIKASILIQELKQRFKKKK